jgi:hypothetical protein
VVVTTDRTQLSPGGAIVIGAFFGLVGTIVTLVALGTFGDGHLSDGTPPRVGIAAGVLFLLAGLAIIVGYGIAGGAMPNGDLPPGTPRVVRVVQTALGLGIVAVLASIASWIAFGAGPRHFSGHGPLISGAVSEMLGRAVFGVGAVLMWAFMAALVVISVRRLRDR